MNINKNQQLEKMHTPKETKKKKPILLIIMLILITPLFLLIGWLIMHGIHGNMLRQGTC